MTANSHPGVAQTLELLERLKGTVCDFAAREEKLRRESSAELAKLRQSCQQAIEEEEARASEEIKRTEAFFEAEKQGRDSRHTARKARISKAYKSAKQRYLEELEGHEGRRKYEIQRDLLQTDRNRDAALKDTQTASESFAIDLAAQREALVGLEQRARSCFRGYGQFLRLLSAPPEPRGLDLSPDHNQLLESLRTLLGRIEGQLNRFRRFLLPLLFRCLPLWLLTLLIVLGSVALALVPVLGHFEIAYITYRDAAATMVACLAAVVALYFVGRRVTQPAATAIATALGQARQLDVACEQKSVAWHQQEIERIKLEAHDRTQMLQGQWKQTVKEAADQRVKWVIKIDQKAKRALERNDERHRTRLEQLERAHAGRVVLARKAAEAGEHALEAEHAEKERRLEAKCEAQWQALEAEWKGRMRPFYDAVNAACDAAQKFFPEWQPALWQAWTPPQQFAHAVKFARMSVSVDELSGVVPQNERLAFAGPTRFDLPLLLTFPRQGSLLFETKTAGRDQAIAALNNIILRLFSVAPPGRVNFTIIDPVELGQSFAGLMHLADYEERLINSRIWTQTGQIEEQLAKLNEHIEKVTQMYLRNEYETIAEYNEQAGRIAEKYHFLVVADFPVNFSDLAVKRLLSIAASGPRCGVYTLIHWDQRRPAPLEFVPDELRKSSVCVHFKGEELALNGQSPAGTILRLDAPPEAGLATEFLQQVGRHSIDSNRVETPFADVAPEQAERWREDTTLEVRVPIGRTGATKIQYLALGKGTRQHALIAGKTGSGKSTLFHVIITNLSLWCSPEQVEFYLVDFKKGVEFKCYATHRLPHARVVAIESDREFGLSVLQRVDEELKRRGELFRKLGVQDLAGYKKAGGLPAQAGSAPLPRTLLLIDEFQEFFVEDDRISQSAALLLDRIVRQGRAFGIHVLLGSQTLGGAYTLARATLGQMVVRIALQCNEADAYLIMDENNAAPRLLSRPGEAIYNDAAGSLEGNSPFQVVWLPDDIRETYLENVRQIADATGKDYASPIVFEGNAPAHVEENTVLRRLLEAEAIKPVTAARVWLGAPNSIKGPTEAVFRRQSGNNLLIVGQRDEAALAMLAVSLVSLAVQHPRQRARFIVFDADPPDSPNRRFVEKIRQAVPHEMILAANADLDGIMTGLADEMEQRNDPGYAATAPVTYLLIHGLQRFKKFRHEEDFGFSLDDKTGTPSGVHFNKLICEGTSLGFHVICTCDTVNNVNRFLSRKALSEFEMRVLFQMSANDSAALTDSPKANNLGLHRAIFYNEQEGYLETFRPYALPEPGWIGQAARNLARLLR